VFNDLGAGGSGRSPAVGVVSFVVTSSPGVLGLVAVVGLVAAVGSAW
jgi:hypothetical protein